MLELLQIAFDGAARMGGGFVIAEQPDPDNRNAVGSYRVTPIAMKELPDGRVALVTNSQNEEDGEFSSHGQPGLLSVYLFKHEGQQWKLQRRFENVDALGSHGQIGQVEWLSLGEGKPGFAVVSGGTWQGYTVSGLSVYSLADPAMKDLAQGVSLYSSSGGACVDESDNCWEVEGKWRFEKRDGQAFDDLVLDFSGYRESRPEGAPADQPRSRTDLKGTARYRFNGSVYGLVEGENIVPRV